MKTREPLITVNPPSLREMLARQGIQSNSSRASRHRRQRDDREVAPEENAPQTALTGLDVRYIEPEVIELAGDQD